MVEEDFTITITINSLDTYTERSKNKLRFIFAATAE